MRRELENRIGEMKRTPVSHQRPLRDPFTHYASRIVDSLKAVITFYVVCGGCPPRAQPRCASNPQLAVGRWGGRLLAEDNTWLVPREVFHSVRLLVDRRMSAYTNSSPQKLPSSKGLACNRFSPSCTGKYSGPIHILTPLLIFGVHKRGSAVV